MLCLLLQTRILVLILGTITRTITVNLSSSSRNNNNESLLSISSTRLLNNSSNSPSLKLKIKETIDRESDDRARLSQLPLYNLLMMTMGTDEVEMLHLLLNAILSHLYRPLVLLLLNNNSNRNSTESDNPLHRL